MLKNYFKRLLTATRAIEGTWVKKSPTVIEDSYLGTLISEEPVAYKSVGNKTCVTNIVFRKSFELDGVGKFELSFFDSADLEDTIRLARSLVAGFPRKNYWYRLVLAWHHRDVHRLMSEGPIVSVHRLASQLIPYRIFVWPKEDLRSEIDVRAEIWYSADRRLLGGSRVCLVLDSKRRYVMAGMG